MHPCGKCLGCRSDRRRDWGTRLYHESLLHRRSAFLTITYSDDHVPADHKLNPDHLRDFLSEVRTFIHKRDRKLSIPRDRKVGWYAVGEYGETTGRPHYHAVLFGEDFLEDATFMREEGESLLYRSPILGALWGKGFVDVGRVNPGSCNYVAKYVSKKVDDPDTIRAQMTKHPALGKDYALKFWQDMEAAEACVLTNGRVAPIPMRYFDWVPELQHLRRKRLEFAAGKPFDPMALRNKEINRKSLQSLTGGPE